MAPDHGPRGDLGHLVTRARNHGACNEVVSPARTFSVCREPTSHLVTRAVGALATSLHAPETTVRVTRWPLPQCDLRSGACNEVEASEAIGASGRKQLIQLGARARCHCFTVYFISCCCSLCVNACCYISMARVTRCQPAISQFVARVTRSSGASGAIWSKWGEWGKWGKWQILTKWVKWGRWAMARVTRYGQVGEVGQVADSE